MSFPNGNPQVPQNQANINNMYATQLIQQQQLFQQNMMNGMPNGNVAGHLHLMQQRRSAAEIYAAQQPPQPQQPTPQQQQNNFLIQQQQQQLLMHQLQQNQQFGNAPQTAPSDLGLMHQQGMNGAAMLQLMHKTLNPNVVNPVPQQQFNQGMAAVQQMQGRNSTGNFFNQNRMSNPNIQINPQLANLFQQQQTQQTLPQQPQQPSGMQQIMAMQQHTPQTPMANPLQQAMPQMMQAGLQPSNSQAPMYTQTPSTPANMNSTPVMDVAENKRFPVDQIKHVQQLIERCLKSYLSMSETIELLASHHQIEPNFIILMWQKLEQQNPDFFKAYIIRQKIKEQISMFNDVVNAQASLMTQQGVLVQSTLPVLNTAITAPAIAQTSQGAQFALPYGSAEQMLANASLTHQQPQQAAFQLQQNMVNASMSGIANMVAAQQQQQQPQQQGAKPFFDQQNGTTAQESSARLDPSKVKVSHVDTHEMSVTNINVKIGKKTGRDASNENPGPKAKKRRTGGRKKTADNNDSAESPPQAHASTPTTPQATTPISTPNNNSNSSTTSTSSLPANTSTPTQQDINTAQQVIQRVQKTQTVTLETIPSNESTDMTPPASSSQPEVNQFFGANDSFVSSFFSDSPSEGFNSLLDTGDISDIAQFLREEK